jgi:hypothetical protein
MIVPSLYWFSLVPLGAIEIGLFLFMLYSQNEIRRTRPGKILYGVYPICATILFASVATVLYTSVRLFGSTTVLGVTVAHTKLMDVSTRVALLSFLVLVCLVIWVSGALNKTPMAES